MVRSRTAPEVEQKYKLSDIEDNEDLLTKLQKDVVPDTQLSSTSKKSVENRVITARFGLVNTQLSVKVDKVEGKNLSTNDFTDEYVEKITNNEAARHTHENKSILDIITQEDKESIHTHDNKSILDSITQNDIDNWNDVTKSNVYSTNEIVIGKWINNKPIYRKVINFGALPNASTTTINHNISNIDFITKCTGISLNTTFGSTFPLPFAHSEAGGSIYLFANRNSIMINTGTANRSGFTETYIILEYTKTTD